jgi:NAD(P)H-hydrate repair Nnr-like enzyme with NAD(P)H-hydrate dehydratase domain
LLAGYVAGLLAQPAWRQDPLLAVRYAVWQHGAAADHLSDTLPNWTVEDLAAWLGRINPSSANGVHDLNLNPNPNPNPAPPSPRD